MKARIAPTSPAAQPKIDAVSKIWKDGTMLQPLRLPWGKLVMMVLLISLIVHLGLILGLGWYQQYRPNTWLARMIPVTTTTTTTVVQQVQPKDQTVVPAAVGAITPAAYGLARNQGQGGLYTSGNVTGFAWPLSSNGWLLTIDGAWPADVKSLAILPAAGASQLVTSTVSDPGSPFVFLKTSDLHVPPLAFAPAEELQSGQRVWVIGGGAPFARQLNQSIQPTWLASDQLETTWTLDVAVDVAPGSAVVDASGRLLGVIGNEHRLWPVATLTEVLNGVLANGAINRPALGIRTLDRATAVTSGQAALSGLLIGAVDGQTAVAPKSPADLAGLKSGDVITTLNDKPASGDLLNFLRAFKPGDSVKINYQRQGNDLSATVKLGSSRS